MVVLYYTILAGDGLLYYNAPEAAHDARIVSVNMQAFTSKAPAVQTSPHYQYHGYHYYHCHIHYYTHVFELHI